MLIWMEHRRLWRSPVLFFLTAVCLCMNIFLIFRNAYSDRDTMSVGWVSADKYRSIYENLSEMTPEEQNALVDEVQKSDISEFYDDENVDIDIYYVLKNEWKYIGAYDNYYTEKKTEFAKKTSARIFGTMDAYSRKSSQKTLDTLQKFCGTKVEPGPSRGIRIVLENFTTDILILFLVLASMVLTFMKDKEHGTVEYLKTTYHGRGAFLQSKLISYHLYAAEIIFLMYASDFYCGWFIYGMGDMSRSLQSVYGYIGTGIGGGLIQALLFFYGYKCLAVAVFLLVAMFFMVCCARSPGAYLSLAVVYACSAFCYYMIPANHVLSFWKNMNPVAFLNTGRIFSSYRNIRMFGYPVSYQHAVLVACLLFLIGMSLVLTSLFGRIRQEKRNMSGVGEFWQKYRLSKRRAGRERIVVMPFFWQECKKIFGRERVGLYLTGLLVVLFVLWQQNRQIYLTQDEAYYKAYVDEIQGKCTDAKIVQVLKWKNEIVLGVYQKKAELKESKGKLSQMAIQRKYQKLLDKKDVVERLYEHTAYLKKVEGSFFYDKGYRELTGGEEDNAKDGFYALGCAGALLILLCGVFSRDYVTGMYPLMETTSEGRVLARKSRILYGIFMTVGVYAAVYGSWYVKVFKNYGTAGLHAPVVSMEHISMQFQSFTVLEYLAFVNVVRLAGFLLMTAAADFLAARLKSTVLLMLAMMGIFILPLLIYLLGMDFMKWILLNPLFLGNLNG